MRRAVRWVAAAADVPRLLGAGRAAAEPAEAVALVPPAHAAGIGEERALAVRQQRADLAQIHELRRRAEAQRTQRLLERREVEGEEGRVLVHAEQHRLAVAPGQLVHAHEYGARA